MTTRIATKQTGYLPWRPADTAVSVAETAPAAATSKWATFSSTYAAKAFTMPAHSNTASLAFTSDANNQTATVTLYAYRSGGPAELIGVYDLTSGAQVNDDSRYWVDTIVASGTPVWPIEPTLSDEGGNDRVSKIVIDMLGYKHLVALFTTIGAGNWKGRVAYY